MKDFYNNYQSPFSWRYASKEMRAVWSEIEKRKTWRKIWVALARVEAEFGLVNASQIVELESQSNQIDMDTALEIENELHHDLMAELKTFAGQCPTAGGVLHMGATSMDIEDNADALRIRAALDLIQRSLSILLLNLAEKIEVTAGVPVMGFTHLQPAEPTTLGYRLAFYAQDLLEDWKNLTRSRSEIRGKGFKGAVGTSASYADLIGIDSLELFEKRMSDELGLDFFEVSNQTYPRKLEYQVINALAGLGASLHKFAFDLRVLQSPGIGELSEPFGNKQVGSSAMPFKRNPIQSEKIDSLARSLANLPQVAWHNAANSLLERTLDDSANRRTLLPEAFLICDEILLVANRLVKGLVINETNIQRNLDNYAPFASTERILMAVGKKGGDRQEMHEILRSHAMNAWQEVQLGRKNPLLDMIQADENITHWLTTEEINNLSNIQGYTGLAVRRCQRLIARIRQSVS